MAKVYHIFKGIPEIELREALDESGGITNKGREILRKIGVIVEEKVSIGRSTIKNLVGLYNEWKKPKIPPDSETELIVGKFLNIQDDDIFLYEKLDLLMKSYKMGIKIGKGTKIGENVSLGIGVSIGKYCEISDFCELCIFSTIQDHVYLGRGVFVGKDSDIESGSKIMDKAVIAPRNIVPQNSFIAEKSLFNENIK